MPLRPLFAALLALTAVRLVVGLAHELTPAEASLWLCAKHPAMGYFDHGPMAAWVMWLSTAVLGDTIAGVRGMSAGLMLAASLLAYRLAASAFGEKSAAWTLAVINLIPLTNLGGVLGHADSWAFAFGVASVWLLWRALHRASGWTWHWPAAGLAMGFSALSAPAGLALAPGMILLLAGPRRWRGRWRRPGPWLALGVMALAVSPWLWWQSAHDWLPWRSHWFAWRHGFSLRGFFLWIWWLVAAVSPFVLAGLSWAVVGAGRDGVRSWLRRRRGGLQADDPFDQKNGRVFLLALAAPGMVWAAVSALMGSSGLGMVALPVLAGLMLLVARWIETPVAPSAHRLAQSATLLVAGAYSLAALDSDLARHFGLSWPYALDPTSDRRGWRETAAAVATARSGLETAEPATPVIVIAEPAELASVLNFYLPRPSPALACHVIDRLAVDSDFAFWPGYAAAGGLAAGGGALLVTEAGVPVSLGPLQQQFESVESLGEIEIRRGGQAVRRLTLFACRRYRGPGR